MRTIVDVSICWHSSVLVSNDTSIRKKHNQLWQAIRLKNYGEKQSHEVRASNIMTYN